MRKSIIKGNGAICDFCKTELYPNETIHIRALKNKDCTGGCVALSHCHMCEKCYDEILSKYMLKPRKKKGEG